MKKLATVFVSAFLSSAAMAVPLDTFSTLQGPVIDQAGGAAASSTVGNRTITVTATGSNLLGEEGRATSNGNSLTVSNTDGVTSLVNVSYNLAAISGFSSLPGGALEFVFLSHNPSNQGGGPNLPPTQISVTFSGTAGNFNLAPQTIPIIPPSNGTMYFALSASQLAAITGGGTFSFSITGGNSYDLELDAVNLVPEPATLALMGMGFVGLGIARRRKAA